MRDFFIFLIILFTGLYFDIFNIFRYCIISSILHEAGHIITYRTLIGKWPVINISVFGFTMQNDIRHSARLPLVLISGPLMNLLLCIVSSVMLNINFRLNYLVFLIINAIILIFNILPVYYLDGGQILYEIWPFYQKNYIEISTLAIIFISVMVMCFTGINISVLLFSAYFIINTLNDI